MNNPAFIVDGQQEQKIIQFICPGTAVRRLNCNGDAVELTAAAKRIASLIRLMRTRYHPFIVIFDREGRAESSQSIADMLLSLIRIEGVRDDIVIGVPDRMIENWLLADYHNLCERLGQGTLQHHPFEGTDGKAEILNLLPGDKHYHETTEGVEWFIAANSFRICKNSASFREFLGALPQLCCRWLLCHSCCLGRVEAHPAV
jgi:hypothetical protein